METMKVALSSTVWPSRLMKLVPVLSAGRGAGCEVRLTGRVGDGASLPAAPCRRRTRCAR
jgi:hypothetical protein